MGDAIKRFGALPLLRRFKPGALDGRPGLVQLRAVDEDARLHVGPGFAFASLQRVKLLVVRQRELEPALGLEHLAN